MPEVMHTYLHINQMKLVSAKLRLYNAKHFFLYITILEASLVIVISCLNKNFVTEFSYMFVTLTPTTLKRM
jgi:hypothetical protein